MGKDVPKGKFVDIKTGKVISKKEATKQATESKIKNLTRKTEPPGTGGDITRW